MPDSESDQTRDHSSSRSKCGAPNRSFPVVGIAASAGGLEAFKALLTALPPDTGMAYVLVPHLDPSHASLMVDLLRPHTKMPVEEAHEGVPVQPNRIYVIPPNRNLEIHDGALHLSEPDRSRPASPPIDLFLRSLAEDQHEMAIGIVLSGTGSHGTAGLQAIKARGGLTIVQDPGEAEYEQMPSSAIAADTADHVLPVARMPETLRAYVRHPYANGAAKGTLGTEDTDYLGRILALLKARTKYNFSDYRKKMLVRRIQRRMSLNQVEEPDRYIEMLRSNAEELKELFQDLLIDVSGFFRDPEAFNILAQRIIPELIEHRAGGDAAVRVWIPGCATGEEAYSIAILFYEAMDRLKKHVPLQIFATDINEQALTTARQAIYPEGIATDVTPERLQRFFTKAGSQYHVTKALRETVMFAAQNLISDPPFSKLDLISCRNLLIYLESETQQRVLNLFHFALNEDGYLFLGSSETLGRQTDLFEPISKKWRIFRRTGSLRANRVEYPLGPHFAAQATMLGKESFPLHEAVHREFGIGKLAEKLLLDTYTPACVVINRKFEILYLHGATPDYLALPSGEPTHNLLAMADAALSARIRGLCHQVDRGEQEEVQGESHVKRAGTSHAVRVTVKAVHHPKGLEDLKLVSFEDIRTDEAEGAAKLAQAGEKNDLVEQLEFELKTTREELQSTIEELESSNEELKSSNEEMMSMNEELQSVNEELESSKEELQSLNEELNTVNNQLEEKITELDKSQSDLTNLLNSAEIATLFLDMDLRIRRYTPSMVKLLNLMPGDVGRSISDFSYKFNDDALLADARQVLETLSAIDKHVWTDDGICYLRRILPYRTVDNRIEGVVVTFVDITTQIAADRELQRVAALLKEANVAIIVTRPDGRITGWNPGAERLYGYSENEALGMNDLELIPSAERDKARHIMERITAGEDVGTFETRRVAKNGKTMGISVSATRLTDERGKVIGLIAAEHDVTERRHLETELRNLNEDLRAHVAVQSAEAVKRSKELEERERHLSAIINTAPDGIITVNQSDVITGFNPAAQRMFGYSAEEAAGQNVEILFLAPPDGKQDGDLLTETMMPDDQVALPIPREFQGKRKDGTPFPMEVNLATIDHLGVYLMVTRDISAQRNLEKEIIDISSQEQERIGHEIHDGLGQRLSALIMMATSLEKQFADSSAPQAALCKDLVKQLRGAADEAHALSQGLVPVPLDPAGLKVSLRHLSQDVSSQSGIPCRLNAAGAIKLNDRVQALQLFRIAQEALNNAVKHASPGHIIVDLAADGSGVTLKVSDDGTGFDPQKNSINRLGLHIMRYRANLIGATLDIHSEKGKGTVVRCNVPTPPAQRRR